jgi:ankyrin repeat protein
MAARPDTGGARRVAPGTKLLDRASLDVRFPLHYATLKGDVERVKYLLGVFAVDAAAGPGRGGGMRRGPSMRADDEDDLGRMPLHVAAAFGHTEICNVLLDMDSNLIHCRAHGMQNMYPLHLACAGGWERDSFLSDDDFYASLPGLAGEADEAPSLEPRTRSTEAKEAAELTENQKRRLAVVTLLLERGADATARNDTGTSPLHLAAGCGDLECAKKLVEYGMNACAHKPHTHAHTLAHVHACIHGTAILPAQCELQIVANCLGAHPLFF